MGFKTYRRVLKHQYICIHLKHLKGFEIFQRFKGFKSFKRALKHQKRVSNHLKGGLKRIKIVSKH